MTRSSHTRNPAIGGGRRSGDASGAPCSASARFEDVPTAVNSSLGVFRYDRPSFERGWHYHPEAELTLILESSGRRLVGDHLGTFEAGDLVLLGPNLPHTWRNEAVLLPRGRRARSIYVHFRTAWLDETTVVLPELHEIRRLLTRAARGLCFAGSARDCAARELKRLPELAGLRRVLGFWELLQGLAEAGGGEPLSSAGFAPVLDELACARIRKIHRHVYEHFRSGIVHQDLARLAGLSPAALSKFFRRTTGRTLTEFINEVRVGAAARRLIDTTENVSEIAYASGFESLANFNSTFRHLKQMNPSRFRELHRKP
ncbi:MAG: helix-turn-helix domain-containing protein [Verrucomicrobia bacterium]|nr:helix-turn-helix domain-containing protein [Verrucomicrobiota bacterium]